MFTVAAKENYDTMKDRQSNGKVSVFEGMGVHVIWKHQKGMGFKVGCIVGERLGASNYTRSSTT